MRIVLVALMTLFFSGRDALAQDCRSITDPTARLTCFDKAPPAAAKTAKKPAAAVDAFAPAKVLLQRKMVDPESARFTDLFKVQTSSEGDVVCGIVNSKNRMGGYVGGKGFIFEPRLSRATIMATGDSDPDYSLQAAAAYCVHCAPDPRSDRTFTTYCPSMLKFRR